MGASCVCANKMVTLTLEFIVVIIFLFAISIWSYFLVPGGVINIAGYVLFYTFAFAIWLLLIIVGGGYYDSITKYGHWSLVALWFCGYAVLSTLFIISSASRTPASPISITEISNYNNYLHYQFLDGNILSNLTQCGFILGTNGFNYLVGIAPLVPFAQNFSAANDSIPAFVITADINSQCQLLNSSGWDLPVQQGSLLVNQLDPDEVSSFIQNTFNLSMTPEASSNVIFWEEVLFGQERAKRNSYIAFSVITGTCVLVYLLALVYYLCSGKRYKPIR